MEYPDCQPIHIRKNRKKKGKQNHICVDCGRQFIDRYDGPGYPDEFKRECLKMSVNGMGLRVIERAKGVHYTTVTTGVKQVDELLPNTHAEIHTSILQGPCSLALLQRANVSL